ncbi:MAG TPA: IclR family transcriptional regulator [Actinomycetota bacterium]|nr:IclR family transcriptional regulator [Actinomycetota bacterium]
MARALGILEELAGSTDELGVTELGRRLGVHKATASRLLATLAEHGLVERNPVSDRYRLGFGLVRLAAVVSAGLDLVRQARPVLEWLAQETGETVNLAVLDADQVIHLDQVSAAGPIVTVSWVGRRTPLHCTSNGKVLLAHLPKRDRLRLLPRRLERLTPSTITDRELLLAQLLEVEVRGSAYTLEELEVGLNAVAAPIRDSTGAVVAAVSVSGPAYRLSRARIPEFARAVREAGDEISARLGSTPGVTARDRGIDVTA